MSKKIGEANWKTLFFEAFFLLEDLYLESDDNNRLMCRVCDRRHKKLRKLKHSKDCHFKRLLDIADESLS